ncbi:Sterol-4-alpha-carboxylate 3-dehydrogenase, decarboxylating [Scheffersomyces stipitis CBS 6054]|uniref:Sterol-4-alpha-carboxylate 3-dehydrogenase ERG26, decarboxylating n=1 Tax=Scheffersomyces stipitis (strain ATCC 58785 / CBS 6054 / NBRC 10063 / NRRL Y-11545) TaxID=322104 RepID=A3LS95_PICST|nr:Sterol-4-alpha-carboxylate 3-dehydrogenase, decarboxylating [Scheffersomyces stipitis CBS 6054]ABN65530.1 Sterol-4-alpha-carboxylate 3-dehydrogenase, decarboxylating [Scheffersomyces stipitis CBS 6054]
MTMKLNSVLLIGGSGFLGLHLIEQFYRHCPNTKLYVFDVRPLPDKLASYFTFPPEQIGFFKGDLTSEKDVSEAISESKCDVIVHSASPMHGLAQEIYTKVNVQGTQNVIEVAKKLKVKALVYTSSAGVIFNGQDVKNANESWPYPEVHMDGYNETKAIAEAAVMEANDKNGLLTVCLRPAGIFGPGDRQLVPGLRASAKLGQSKFQLGDNNNLFDWTYVGNVADAHVLAAQKVLDPLYAESLGGETFFVTNDAPTYFWTLARTVWKADGYIDKYYIKLNRPVAIVLGYFSEFFSKLAGKEPGITPFRVKVVCAHRYHDIIKAKTVLGYRPAVDLELGIRYTLEWMDETS